ncbi:MAG: glycosyl transferase [Lachnospiraceae bacterium]|nr:glycosyl transferase [Lachnospiraceae bacterium]
MLNFCTLFDSCYLDKGIALYHSLEQVSNNFMLYTFCFDDRSFKILKDKAFTHMVLLHHSVFETNELLKLKQERSKAEYCWTCTPVIIEYVLSNFSVDSCTYLDSDLYFFVDPQILFDEIERNKADVVIVPHRFKNNKNGRKMEERNGKYCVQFNYFRQTVNGRKVLNWWKEKCFEWCFDIPDLDRMGDQKYLNSWVDHFDGVYELQYLGGGVAPWNLEQYKICDDRNNRWLMQDKYGKKFKLVFYHFQNMRYLPGNKVNIKSQTKNKELKYSIYIPYLKEIEEIRKNLQNEYSLFFRPGNIQRSSNAFLGFLQRKFAAFKIQTISDIVDLKKLDRYLKWKRDLK